MRIARRHYFVITDKFSAIHLRHMKAVVASLKDRESDIRRALDVNFQEVVHSVRAGKTEVAKLQ